jgi:hypothetical protein
MRKARGLLLCTTGAERIHTHHTATATKTNATKANGQPQVLKNSISVVRNCDQVIMRDSCAKRS